MPDMALAPVLAEKLSVALAETAPFAFTARDARLPAVPGKVHAVIGMRRAGKTTFLRQLLDGRRASLPPEQHTLFVGKFLTVGQARKEGVASGKDFIQLMHGDDVPKEISVVTNRHRSR
jgi:hypothetical protein